MQALLATSLHSPSGLGHQVFILAARVRIPHAIPVSRSPKITAFGRSPKPCNHGSNPWAFASFTTRLRSHN